MELSEQELVRRDKLNKIKEMGIDPYPEELFPVSYYSIDSKNEFKIDEEYVGILIKLIVSSREFQMT